MADVFGAVTPQQKGKRLGEMFEEIFSHLSNDAQVEDILAHVPTRWSDVAEVFLEAARQKRDDDAARIADNENRPAENGEPIVTTDDDGY